MQKDTTMLVLILMLAAVYNCYCVRPIDIMFTKALSYFLTQCYFCCAVAKTQFNLKRFNFKYSEIVKI